MPNLTVSIPHQLDRAEAKRRIQDQIARLRQEHGAMLAEVKESWNGDVMDFSVSAMGQSVSGHLTVADQIVHLEVVLPWLLKMLAGTVKQKIEQQGQLLLSSQSPKETTTRGKNDR